MPQGEGVRIARVFSLEKKIKQLGQSSSNKMNDEIRSLRVELMRKRAEENKNIWTGMFLSSDEVFDLTS